MTEADRKEFGALLVRLDTVYEKKPSKIKGDEYWSALADIPIALLQGAVSQHIREARSYPRVSDLRQLCDAQVQKSAPLLLAAPQRDPDAPAVHNCNHCADTGWQLASGKGIEEWEDPISGKAPTVKPCPCRTNNPSLQPPKRYASRNTDVRRPW
jgi:hypothetical protein